jgi:uncharacterized membrane protein
VVCVHPTIKIAHLRAQLAIKVYQVPSEQQTPWTTFEMPLRVSETIPNIFDFTRFLASSITFMEHLSEVSVFLDDKRLSLLRKNSGSLQELAMPKDLVPTSQNKTMTVRSLRSSGTCSFVYRDRSSLF